MKEIDNDVIGAGFTFLFSVFAFLIGAIIVNEFMYGWIAGLTIFGLLFIICVNILFIYDALL